MVNKRIVVFGGAGSIGSELVRQLAGKNKVYVVDINESGIFDLVDSIGSKKVWGRVGDIRDAKTVHDVFEDFRPQIVYNAAAYKHVPLMEYTPMEAIQTNIIGHYNIIHSAKTHRETLEKFVYISTDKVVNSRSVMGASKRIGEILTLNQGKGYLAVRFGNVVGSRGSLSTIWDRQFANGEPLTITDKRMERYMMSVEQAVGLVIEATVKGEGGEIFILDMGKKVNILDLKNQLYGEDYPVKYIGIRPGETLTEETMFEEEKARAITKGSFIVIK